MLLTSLLFACSASTPPPPPAPPPPAASANPLVGHWHGELAGGPIAAVADYTFLADGTYSEIGYPSIGESGRYSVTEPSPGSLVLHLTGRLKCGPCENAGPNEPAADADEAATLNPDGTLAWRNWTFSLVK